MPPPRLSFEEPRCWWTVVKLSGARLWTMHPGASDVIQVSVKTRMSNAPSCMLSFMRAALLTADLELSRPNFRLAWRRLQAWFKLLKLDLETYNSYTDHIMPRTPGSLSYEETKEVLEDMLGDKISVFRRRIDVMRLAIGNLTFRKLRSTINRMVALAQFDSLTKENFKCLIYISALQGTKYADIRTRLLQYKGPARQPI